MIAYHEEVGKLEDKFDGLEYLHIIRSKNEEADALAKLGSSRSPVPPETYLQVLAEPSIQRRLLKDAKAASGGGLPVDPTGGASSTSNEVAFMDVDEPGESQADWRQPIIDALNGRFPEDIQEAERLRQKLKLYVLQDGELYKLGASGIMMKCMPVEQGRQLLNKIHSEVCGNHAGAKTTVGKAYRQGFFWPTAVTDSADIVRRCEGCQFFARQMHVPAQELTTIPITWPFSTWGLDMVGPFKTAKGGFTHLFVAVDKFTKWIEAKPVATITAAKAIEFIRDIVCRFGVPRTIITDNGTQFKAQEFKDYCDSLGTSIHYASVAHPRSNGQVERANGMILQGLKPRIFDRLLPYAGRWVKELPSVLWALRTTPTGALGRSPFMMVYGSEAMLPTEIEFGSHRVKTYDDEANEEHRATDVNALEELRDLAVIRSAKYQQAMRRYYDRHVKHRGFQVGDLVLKKVQSTKDRHKLSPIWEGPYIVKEVTRPGSYRLQTEEGEELPNSWNVAQFWRFYV
jgi:transposase InsO family protein